MRSRTGRLLAAAGLAVAGLAAPLATFAAFVGARDITVPIALLSWLGLAIYFVGAPRLWPELTRGHARWNVAIGPIAAVVGFLIGFYVSYSISIDKDLCGRTSPALIAGAVAYVVAAAFGLARGRFATAVWIVSPLLGWLIQVGLLFVLPGTHGYCET